MQSTLFTCLSFFATIINKSINNDLEVAHPQSGVDAGFEPRPYWKEASAPPTAPSLAPQPCSPTMNLFKDAKESSDSFKIEQTCLNMLACTVLSTATKKD